jgi:small subunit ribosomal protein S21
LQAVLLWGTGEVQGKTADLLLAELEAQLIKVRPRGNESIQQMLKRFKRLCQREGLTRDMKRNSYYEKPSERRRRKQRKSARRQVAA